MMNAEHPCEDQEAVKISFALSAEEAGPYPVASESIWCVRERDGYRIKNIPFFVEGLAFDDVVSIEPVEDGFHRVSRVLLPSGNSTIWIYLQDRELGVDAIKQLKSLGCGVESGVFDGYYAVNVPEALSIVSVYAVLDSAVENESILVDYPAIRHEESEDP